MLGFPCNQFGRQEPGTNAEILAFAATKYGVTFPMFAKLEVNGPNAAPLFRFLREARPNPDGTTDITWNFNKFLVDRAGEPVVRWQPKVTPEQIEAELGRWL